MKIEVFFSPTHVDELSMRGRNVVIIDVLRSSTTICAALKNGAREVIPAPDIENATKISANLSSDSRLLGGERQGKKIDGFDLGNSPLEYTPEKIGGKTIVFTSTNGSETAYKCRYASMALIGAFVNVSSVVQSIVDVGGTWTIICSGQQGAFSIEDATCAGMIISKIQAALEVETDDAGLTALILYKNFKRSIVGMLRRSTHGRYLASIGFSEDLKFCAAVDSVPIVPTLNGVGIKLKVTGSKLSSGSNEFAVNG